MFLSSYYLVIVVWWFGVLIILFHNHAFYILYVSPYRLGITFEIQTNTYSKLAVILCIEKRFEFYY